MKPPTKPRKKITRRDFLGKVAIGTFLFSSISSFLTLFRFPWMRSFPEPSKVFRIGAPSNFQIGGATYLEAHNLNVFRNDKGFYAISAVCTHLGCVVKSTDKEFKCPCHGSLFDKNGNVISGPAPRALEWYSISLDPSGQLVVDANNAVPQGTYFSPKGLT